MVKIQYILLHFAILTLIVNVHMASPGEHFKQTTTQYTNWASYTNTETSNRSSSPKNNVSRTTSSYSTNLTTKTNLTDTSTSTEYGKSETANATDSINNTENIDRENTSHNAQETPDRGAISTTLSSSTSSSPSSTTSSTNSFYYGDAESFYGNYDLEYYEYSLSMFFNTDDLLEKNETLQFIATFENMEQQHIITQQLRYCPYVPLCGFSFNVSINDTYGSMLPCCLGSCSCEHNCEEDRTCCPDIITTFTTGRNHKAKGITTTSVYNNVTTTTANIDGVNKLSCIRMHITRKDPKVFDQTGALVISHCLNDPISNYQTNCTREYSIDIETFDDVLPVSIKHSNVTYRNKYCALCNNVDENELIFWSPMFTCLTRHSQFLPTERHYLKEALTNDKCDIKFYSNYSKPAECHPIISKCNVSGNWREYNQSTENACSIFMSIIQYRYEYYQNVFCVFCNGYTPNSVECSKPSGTSVDLFSFAGLLRFDREIQNDDNTENCKDGSLWDRHMGECKPYHCSDIRLQKNGQCVKLYDSFFKMMYVVYVRLIPTGNIQMLEAHFMADQIIPWINKSLFNFNLSLFVLCGAQIMYKSDMHFGRAITPAEIAEAKLLYFDIRLEVYIASLHDPDDVFKKFIELQNVDVTLRLNETIIHMENKTFEITNETVTFKAHIRDDQEKYYTDMIRTGRSVFTDNQVNQITALPFKIVTSYAFTDDVDRLAIVPHYRINDPYVWCEIDTIYYQLIQLRTCPMFEISKLDFSWEDGLTRITFPSTGLALKSSDFSFVEQCNPYRITLCTDLYEKLVNVMSQSKPMSLETILSLICVSVSIVCLLVTFVTFCLFSELRTLPGKNTMTLTLYLLFAQLFYLIGNHGSFVQGSLACKLVGLAIHLFWLLSLFWMNICSIHTFRIFVRNEVISRSSGCKTNALYHTYATISSSVCIAINVIVSLSKSDYANIGYGGGKICYISSAKMQEYTFAIPALVTVGSNLIMFLIVVVKIIRMPEVPSNTKHERNYVKIFAKLSTLTGVTWIFGFVYSWSGLLIFSYLFIILSGGQGVFLMLSFVANSRVLKLYGISFKDTLHSKYTVTTSQSPRTGTV